MLKVDSSDANWGSVPDCRRAMAHPASTRGWETEWINCPPVQRARIKDETVEAYLARTNWRQEGTAWLPQIHWLYQVCAIFRPITDSSRPSYPVVPIQSNNKSPCLFVAFTHGPNPRIIKQGIQVRTVLLSYGDKGTPHFCSILGSGPKVRWSNGMPYFSHAWQCFCIDACRFPGWAGGCSTILAHQNWQNVGKSTHWKGWGPVLTKHDPVASEYYLARVCTHSLVINALFLCGGACASWGVRICVFRAEAEMYIWGKCGRRCAMLRWVRIPYTHTHSTHTQIYIYIYHIA